MFGSQSDYTYESESGAVSIDSTGLVTLNSRPTAPITLVATPKYGDSKESVTYQFTIKHWFTNEEGRSFLRGATPSTCKLASLANLTNSPQNNEPPGNHKVPDNYAMRSTKGNSLAGEWGNLKSYKNANWGKEALSDSLWTDIMWKEEDKYYNYAVKYRGSIFTVGPEYGAATRFSVACLQP